MTKSVALTPKTADTEVYVVRLSGDATGAATARLEGAGFAAADVGNTFTFGTGSAFPTYLSYSSIWLGDSVQDAILDWNGISYLAGVGSGTAGYTHSQLPALSESATKERVDAPITLTAQPGAFVELRFKIPA